MDISKCEAFLQSMDLGSFSAAAEEMGYTPSGINRMVNALEEELGFSLLWRNKRGVTATEEGLLMAPALRELVHYHELSSQQGAQIRGLVCGNLKIGTYYSVAACWLPEIIREFQEDFPGIRINTMEGGNSDLLTWLDERRVDFCFFSECPVNADWIPLKEDPLVVWMPADHPNASLTAFPLKDLNGAPFIKTLPGCKTDIERLLEQDGLTPDVRFTTVDNYTTYCMVAAGLGVSINNELMARNWTGNVVVRPLDPPRCITLGIAVPSLADASPAARKFISYAKRLVGGV